MPGAGKEFAYLANEIVVCQHEVTPRNNHVSRTDVAVNEPIVVKHAQRIAHGSQPPQSQGFAGSLLLLLGQKREDTSKPAKRVRLRSRSSATTNSFSRHSRGNSKIAERPA